MSVEGVVWNVLLAEINNPYGVAGLMGNLKAESSMNPLCKTGGDKNELGVDYAEKVDSGEITGQDFAHDGVAFGLAQWRYWSRKEQLYLFAREHYCGIEDLEMQLAFLLQEIKTYKTVWQTLLYATSVKEASDIVLERYEKPANTSEAIKEKRAKFGETYLTMFATPTTTVASFPEEKPHDYPTTPIVFTTKNNVNFRTGPSTKYQILGQTKNAGTQYDYVATAKNGWYAIDVVVNHKKYVAWMSNEFSKVRLV